MFRRRRIVLLTLGLLAIPAIVVGGGYWWAGANAILPGARGCEYVRETAARTKCVRRVLEDELRGGELQAGLARVDRLADSSELVANHCHLSMHPIGERYGRRAARAGEDPPVARDVGNCRRGFMHGAMIGYVEAGEGDLAEVLPRLCAAQGQREAACAHVVGHTVMRTAWRDDGAEQTLLDACRDSTSGRDTALAEAAGSSNAEVEAASGLECVRGGYMELALLQRQPAPETWAEDCIAGPAGGRHECFSWLPPLATYRKQSQRSAARICERAARAAGLERECVDGVSSELPEGTRCTVFQRAANRARCSRD